MMGMPWYGFTPKKEPDVVADVNLLPQLVYCQVCACHYLETKCIHDKKFVIPVKLPGKKK